MLLEELHEIVLTEEQYKYLTENLGDIEVFTIEEEINRVSVLLEGMDE